MEIISNGVTYIIMACAVAGCIASIFKPDSELGEQFMEGINSIGSIFLPVAGIMASLPILTVIITKFIAPLFSVIGADPSIAATTLLAVDMGGYQLAETLAQTKESWIMATTVGYMAGATIVFSIPVALKIIDEKFHRQMSLGVMIGFITVPIGVFISNLIIIFTNPIIRETISTDATASYVLNLTFPVLIMNLLPLVIICLLLAFGLWKFPETMIKGFSGFGRGVDAFTKIVFTLVVVEYFTGIFGRVFGTWPFDPIIADAVDQNRALEVAGYIGIMLCGAFPMVYLIRKYLSKPIEKLSEKAGLSEKTATGILAASANVIALFSMIDEDMKDYEIIAVIAFSVCGAFVIGDHLAFTANFQPQLIVPLMVGKLAAGILAVIISYKVYKPKKVIN